MKIQIMIGIVALGLIAGCASDEYEDDSAVMNESAGASTGPSIGTKLSDLPAAVQSAIMSRAPNAEIDDIDKEVRSGRVIYEVQFKEPGKNPKLHIAEDGTFVDAE
jgi:hypothetical protein